MSRKLSYALIAGLAFSIVESMPAHALVATPNGFAPIAPQTHVWKSLTPVTAPTRR